LPVVELYQTLARGFQRQTMASRMRFAFALPMMVTLKASL
jgi:hypothetical protein